MEGQLLAIKKYVTGLDVFVSLPTDLQAIAICLWSPQRVHWTNVSCFDCEPTSLTNGRSEGKVPPARYRSRISWRNSAWYCISPKFLGEIQHDTRALQRVKEGQHQLVFQIPENLFHSQGIRKTIMVESFQSKLIAFVVEAHCIKKW